MTIPIYHVVGQPPQPTPTHIHTQTNTHTHTKKGAYITGFDGFHKNMFTRLIDQTFNKKIAEVFGKKQLNDFKDHFNKYYY